MIFARVAAGFAGCLLTFSAARAGAILLASGLNVHGPIGIDGNGGLAFFGQLDSSTCSGELDSIPAQGGAVHTIAPGLNGIDGGICRGFNQILFSTNTAQNAQKAIYSWSTGNADGAIGAADLSGNPVELVGAHFESLVGDYNENAYYSWGFSDLSSVPNAGGATQNLAGGYFIRTTAFDLPDPNYPTGSGGAYFVDYYTSSVFRYDLGTGAATAAIQGNPDEGEILTDSRNIYWSDGNSLVEAVKGTSCTVPACLVLHNGAMGHYFAVDESEADNPAGSVFFSDASGLWRTPKSGSAQSIYTGSNVQILQTDGARVYFLGGQKLMSLPVNATSSTKPLVLANGVVPDYWKLDDSLYWTDTGNGSTGAGRILYVAQPASQLDALQYSSAAAEAGLHKCAAEAALYTALARTVLEAEWRHVPATGAKIDGFYRVTNLADPCAAGGGAADWSGNGSWQNPVAANVTFGARTKVRASTDVSALLAQGPVLLQGTRKVRWLLATVAATVAHAGGTASGISAFDPLSGTKVLLQFDAGAGRYVTALILDPATNSWCAWSVECPNLVKDIRTTAPGYSAYDLGVAQDFAPLYYISATVRP